MSSLETGLEAVQLLDLVVRESRAPTGLLASHGTPHDRARHRKRGAARKNPACRLIGMSPSSRSPLSDPIFGLVWSNRLAPNEVLVRSAIMHGAFHLLLEAVLAHGLEFIEQQLAIMQLDEDAALSDRALAEVRRKLGNIGRGIAAAEQAVEKVTNQDIGNSATFRSSPEDRN